jgi:hypothetical protein
MAKTTKPTKQQIAQAKARAGGNNPIKVTNAGLKKFGQAAVTAATFVPAGRAAKIAVTAAKAAKTAKAAKAVKTAKSSRQAGDYAISGKSAKNVMPKYGSGGGNYRFGRDTDISDNVKIKDTMSPSGKVYIRGGAAQVDKQNARLTAPLSKAEAKANARGLKAANKTTKASKVQKKITSTKKMENVPKDVSDRFNATVKRLAAEEAKKKKK